MNTPKTPGFFGTIHRLATLSLGILRTRLELFGVELQEEKQRQIELMLLAGGVLLLALLALVLFTGVLVLVSPHPAWVAAGLGVIYLLAAMLLLLRLKRRLRAEPFSESIRQLKKDLECLTPPE